MAHSKPIDRVVFKDGQNGIVRLPPLIWRAFYEAAIYLEMDSVQETFIAFLLVGGRLSKITDFVQVVETIESRRALLLFELRRQEIDQAAFDDEIPF